MQWILPTLLLLPCLCAAADAPAEPEVHWEGAIGLRLGWQPEYSGGSRQVVKATPVFFLRYGRITITNASGFRTRRAEDVSRGLGLDLVQGERLRLNLALRVDSGRSEGSSPALQGMGDIEPTLRARATAGYQLAGPWRLGASWSVDAFGRGGGNFGDLSVGWEHGLGAAGQLNLGATLALAQDRYMQTWYGITPEQSARTGYPVYTPGSGLRDITLTAGTRTDFGRDWTLITGAGVSRLLGPAAASPLTGRRNTWGISAGLAWRF